MVGRTVQLNKHPFTIVGVAPPEFHGTIVFFFPDVFVPIVNQEQVEGVNFQNARGTRRIFEVMGHLKAGLTPQQAVADLNSIGSSLEKTYPKDDGKMTFTLARPSLYGDALGPPVQAFLSGLMLLAGLILLAACANLGSLFAARAADRSREVALRLALGSSRLRILRQLFTEALLISLIGGAVGLRGGIVLLRGLSAWQPFARFPLSLPVNPDAHVYGVALLLTLASGFLFGAVPVKRILRTDPYQIVKSGSMGILGRRITVRDLLLAVQIAICAVLVTSSMVSARGLARSLHSNFGFEPKNAMLMSTVLDMAGYRGDAMPTMQKRMIDAMETIPGVQSVGLVDRTPLVDHSNMSNVFTDETTDLRPSNAAAVLVMYSISPEYFHAAGTALLSGRAFTCRVEEAATALEQVLAPMPDAHPTNRPGELALQKTLQLIIDATRSSEPEPLPVLIFLYGDWSGMPRSEADHFIDELLETSAIAYGLKDRRSPQIWSLRPFGEQGAIANYIATQTGGQYLRVTPETYATGLEEILRQLHFRYETAVSPFRI